MALDRWQRLEFCGDTDATASITFHLDSKVQADDGSVIRTANLLVEAIESVSYHTHAHTSGGLLDGGDADAPVTADPKRTIVWNADVYLLGEPNPLLIVDGNGKIVAKSDNVTVRADGVGPALQIDDVIAPGKAIVIDAIIYDQKPTALFRANHVDSVPSTISGTTGVFFMQETWNSVKLLNGSDRVMQLLATLGVSINTLNSAMSSNPSVRASLAMPGYIVSYSCVSPATALLRFSSVLPIGRPVAGSPACFKKSRCPCACPVSPSAVSLKRPATSGRPSTSATLAK